MGSIVGNFFFLLADQSTGSGGGGGDGGDQYLAENSDTFITEAGDALVLES